MASTMALRSVPPPPPPAILSCDEMDLMFARIDRKAAAGSCSSGARARASTTPAETIANGGFGQAPNLSLFLSLSVHLVHPARWFKSTAR